MSGAGRTRARLWVSALATVACGRATTPDPRAHGDAAAASASAPSLTGSPTSAASSAATDPIAALPDGCYSRIDAKLRGSALLDALAQRCTSGTKPLTEAAARFSVKPGAVVTRKLRVDDASRCLRLLVAAVDDAHDLELWLRDPAGHELAHERMLAPFALLGRAGPVCLRSPGDASLDVVAHGSGGDVLLRVAQSE